MILDFIRPKDNIIGMDFDPKKMLYLPESFGDCQKLIKSLSRSERKVLNCHSGHNAVGNDVKAYLRDALFVNTQYAMDNLHTASGVVSDNTYDGEDGVVWDDDTNYYICVTTVNYTGAYYKDVKMVYDNTAGGALNIKGQSMGSNGTGVVEVYTYASSYFTSNGIFTVGANREHFGFWKLTIA